MSSLILIQEYDLLDVIGGGKRRNKRRRRRRARAKANKQCCPIYNDNDYQYSEVGNGSAFYYSTLIIINDQDGKIHTQA